jgi:predicted PurR-regulated permease PerM
LITSTGRLLNAREECSRNISSMRRNTMENLYDALTGLICTGLMIFTAGTAVSFVFFLMACFFFMAWSEGRDD